MITPKPEKMFLRYRFPAILWAVVIFIASSISHIKLPKIEFIAVDKVVHMGIFYVLAILLYRAFYTPETKNIISMKRLVYSALLSMVYGVLDEVHQLFVQGRQCDIYDMIADSLGGLLAGLTIYIFLKWKYHNHNAK